MARTLINLGDEIQGTLAVANGGTGVTSSTGSGSNVLSTSPALTTPNLGTPTALTLTNATGLPIGGLTGLGTGVAAALAIAIGVSGGLVGIGGALGTPSSGSAANLTGLPTSALTGTLAAGQFPALTGDLTTSAGGLGTTLATVNSNTGSFGSSTAIPTLTVNGKGLVTAASTNAVVAPAGTLTGATLASGVTVSSLTSVGTLGSLNVSGNVGIGTGSPTQSLEVVGTILTSGSAAGFYLKDQTPTGTGWVLSSAGGALNLYDVTNNRSPLVITPGISGVFSFTNTTVSTGTGSGALVLSGGLGVAGNVNATAFGGSGASLTSLNASNVTSGNLPQAQLPSAVTTRQSWTPSLLFGGAAVGMTYAAQSGNYIQLGKLIIADFKINLSAVGSSTGSATISGLPATADANSGQCHINFYSGMSGMTAMCHYVAVSGTTVNLNVIGAAGLAAMTNANFGSSSLIYGTITYLAA